MNKRNSLDEVLMRVKEGRHLSSEYVEKVVKRFVLLPLGALVKQNRNMFRLMMLRNLRTEEPDGGIYYRGMLENPSITVLEYLLAYYGAASETGGQSSTVIAALGMLSVYDPDAVKRYIDQTHLFDSDTKLDFAEEESLSVSEEEEQMLRSSIDDSVLDDLLRTDTLRFFHLSLVEYLDYLNTLPGLDKWNLYEEWFRKDVEAWKVRYGTDPTVGDVLFHAVERFRVVEDIYERFPIGVSTELPYSDAGYEIEEPFARRNMAGEYWPPEEEEGVLAGTWIWLLMVFGPIHVLQELVVKPASV